jgi:hypothetical protein
MVSADVVAQAGPYLAAALRAYGAGVLARAEQVAVDGTAQVGRHLLLSIYQHLRGHQRKTFKQRLENAVGAGEHDDAMAALREEIRRLLRADDAIAVDFRSILGSARGDRGSSGERSMVVNGSTIIATTGNIGSLTIHGDPRAGSTTDG